MRRLSNANSRRAFSAIVPLAITIKFFVLAISVFALRRLLKRHFNELMLFLSRIPPAVSVGGLSQHVKDRSRIKSGAKI